MTSSGGAEPRPCTLSWWIVPLRGCGTIAVEELGEAGSVAYYEEGPFPCLCNPSAVVEISVLGERRDPAFSAECVDKSFEFCFLRSGKWGRGVPCGGCGPHVSGILIIVELLEGWFGLQEEGEHA